MRWLIFYALAGTAMAASFETVRNGGTNFGEDVNARDPQGYPLLMHAVLYLPVDGVRALLDRGADINLAGKGGATALMAACGDPAKVRLLVERGADVNARSAGGNTALRHAMNLPSGKSTSLYLLARGAKPEGRELVSALRRRDMELIEAVLRAGAPVTAEAIRRALGNGGYMRMLTEKAPEFAPEAAQRKAVAEADPVELMAITYNGRMDRLQAYVRLGANVNAKDSRGRTALFYAAGADEAQLAAVRFLLANGADAAVKDVRGDTALDIARQRGKREVIEALGGKFEPFREVSLRTGEKMRPAREAVRAALGMLDKSGVEFYKINGCVSCHQQSIPQMSMGAVRKKGLEVDEEASRKQADAVTETLKRVENALWQLGGTSLGGYVATLSYDVVGLAADGKGPTIWSDLAVNALAKAQQESGAWTVNDTRHPLGNGEAKYTALAMRGLLTHPLPGLKEEFAARVARGAAYLESAKAGDLQSLAFRILGLKWAGRPAKIPELARQLEKLQRTNGGWAQHEEMATDVYATSLAVWALHEGAGLGDSAWQQGAAYLRRTQGPDGSWHVRSRGFGFQPYRETGFPHGHDQWLSSAATGFAVLALAPLL